MATASVQNRALRSLPSVDELLRSGTGVQAVSSLGESAAAKQARDVIQALRADITADPQTEKTRPDLLFAAEQQLREAVRSDLSSATRGVVNATGVILHTNLGRAPLSRAARESVAEASLYCTLEYDLADGKRGKRGRRAESLLSELTQAEDVLIVNNCAAAAFFVLTVFGAPGEVLISRGELVEIGGDFRVPDVLSQSGAVLKEVGTTNRTKLADYEKAIGEDTRLILRVHPSNYRIVGFTATPKLSELTELAHKHGILLYEDIGSGALIDLTPFGLTDEPRVADSIAAGVDIITFSGDKLLGGPQAGIIAGRKELIAELRRHPLYRTLRVDKLAYAALEATLDSYRRNAEREEIPVIQMLSMGTDEIRERAEKVMAAVAPDSGLKLEIVDGRSAIGGGAAPNVELATALIAISHAGISAAKLEMDLRNAVFPVIGRIVEDQVMLDLRTVMNEEESILIESLKRLSRSAEKNPA